MIFRMVCDDSLPDINTDSDGQKSRGTITVIPSAYALRRAWIYKVDKPVTCAIRFTPAK